MKIWEVWRTPYKGKLGYTVVESGSEEADILREVWADWNGPDIAVLVDIHVLPDDVKAMDLAMRQRERDNEDLYLGIPLGGIPFNVDPSEFERFGYM